MAAFVEQMHSEQSEKYLIRRKWMKEKDWLWKYEKEEVGQNSEKNM